MRNVLLGALVVVLILIVLLSVLHIVNVIGSFRNNSYPRPPPFDQLASMVPLNAFVDKVTQNNFTIYLPTELPAKCNLTAVYTWVENGSITSRPEAVVVYSNRGDTDIETAEFTLQIWDIPQIGFYVSDSSKEWFTVIGNWTAYVNLKAPTSAEEYYDKYGTGYGIIIDLEIDGLNYGFFFSSPMTLQDATHIVASMRPYKAP